MLRLVTGLSAVAAVGSIALSSLPSIAQSPPLKLNAKQAALMGLPATEAALPEQVVGSIVVKFRASSGLAQAQSGVAYARAMPAKLGVGIKSVRAMSEATALMTLDAPLALTDARAVAARLAADPAVEYAEPDVVMKPFAVPDEPEFLLKQWYLYPPTADYTGTTVVNNMPGPPKTTAAVGGANLPAAWDITKGAASVVVAIVDTGIVNHPELNNQPFSATTYTPGGRFLPGYDFISADALGFAANLNFVANDTPAGRDNQPVDTGDAITAAQRNDPLCNDNTPNQLNVNAPSSWHGTHSAGIVAATTNNTTGMAGIGWENIRVVPVRALGRCGGAMTDVADAILWSAGLAVPTAPIPPTNANPAQVILVGAGGKAGEPCSQTLQAAINAATAAGAVVVAAAGNEGSLDGISAPANCTGVISVTAHAINGENSSYSNIGPAGGAGPNPSISAPGGGPPASLGTGFIDDATWDGFHIWSTTPTGAAGPLAPGIYSRKIGTSAAAAQVAGVAALIKSKTPNVTPAQIKSAIEAGARPFPEFSSCGAVNRPFSGRCGAGMLDATRSLQAAGPPFIVTPPAAVAAAAGATATFTVDAVGATSYQWTRAGAGIPGATSATYTTGVLAATDNNVAFAVVMTNAFGSTTSPPAVLTVSGGSASAPSSGGGALPFWQLLLLSSLLIGSRLRVGQHDH